MSSACWGVFLFKCSRGVVQGGAIWLPERPLEQGGHSEIYQVQHCRQVGKLQQWPQKTNAAWNQSCCAFFFYRHRVTSMFSFRDVVYNKATDDFTVSVKDLKRDIVMDGERLVIVNLISLQPLLLLHDQDDDDHHHYPQVRLRGGRLRPLLGAQRAHLPWRREVPRQGSSCPRLQVSFIEPLSLSLSSSSQLMSFSSH